MPLDAEVDYDYFQHGSASDPVAGREKLSELLRYPSSYMLSPTWASVIIIRPQSAPTGVPKYIKMDPKTERASVMFPNNDLFDTDEVWQALDEAGLTPKTI